MTNSQRNLSGRATVLALIAVVVLLLPVGWTWLTLHWSYSDGERAGVLQKFSRKGWVCKTYEGELAQYVVSNMAPQIWHFTVRDAKVAEQLNAMVGRKLQLHYSEHRGIPSSCFGDTNYYVDSFSQLKVDAIPGQ